MTAPELKPCPFCGSEVTIKRETRIGWIKCTNPHSICIGSGLGFAFISGDEETAISAWNTRTADPNTRVVPVEQLQRWARVWHGKPADQWSAYQEIRAIIGDVKQ